MRSGILLSLALGLFSAESLASPCKPQAGSSSAVTISSAASTSLASSELSLSSTVTETSAETETETSKATESSATTESASSTESATSETASTTVSSAESTTFSTESATAASSTESVSSSSVTESASSTAVTESASTSATESATSASTESASSSATESASSTSVTEYSSASTTESASSTSVTESSTSGSTTQSTTEFASSSTSEAASTSTSVDPCAPLNPNPTYNVFVQGSDGSQVMRANGLHSAPVVLDTTANGYEPLAFTVEPCTNLLRQTNGKYLCVSYGDSDFFPPGLVTCQLPTISWFSPVRCEQPVVGQPLVCTAQRGECTPGCRPIAGTPFSQFYSRASPNPLVPATNLYFGNSIAEGRPPSFAPVNFVVQLASADPPAPTN